LIAVQVFAIMKAVHIASDFFCTIRHHPQEHGACLQSGVRSGSSAGLEGDICYFIAGIVVAVNADSIRSALAG
jgi:hypothetical protein